MKNLLRIGCFLISFPVIAGVKLTCPDLNQEESTSGWEISGTVQKTNFKSVLISMTRVLGVNMVICQYEKPVSLTKMGNFQPAAGNDVWEIINLGGLLFKQCLATREICSFYSAT